MGINTSGAMDVQLPCFTSHSPTKSSASTVDLVHKELKVHLSSSTFLYLT